MMLYGAVRDEGVMQKVAGGLLDKAEQMVENGFDRLSGKGALVHNSPYVGVGALVGGLTNDGNRAAGTLGGAAGGYLGTLASDLGILAALNKLTTIKNPNLLPKYPCLGILAIEALGSAGGGYLGGKLGAKLDSATGDHITKGVNKLLGRE